MFFSYVQTKIMIKINIYSETKHSISTRLYFYVRHVHTILTKGYITGIVVYNYVLESLDFI